MFQHWFQDLLLGRNRKRTSSQTRLISSSWIHLFLSFIFNYGLFYQQVQQHFKIRVIFNIFRASFINQANYQIEYLHWRSFKAHIQNHLIHNRKNLIYTYTHTLKYLSAKTFSFEIHSSLLSLLVLYAKSFIQLAYIQNTYSLNWQNPTPVLLSDLSFQPIGIRPSFK